MKKNLAFLAAAFFCGVLFTSFSPSLDGRAVVADEGVLPKGIFAKTVGYLPGDSISVTNLLNKSTVEVLVIGAIDPSEGVAILLSPEAAKLLGLEKGADSVVKITKRSGQLDEAVAGTAVIGGNGVQDAEQEDAEMTAEAESEEENAESTGTAEDSEEKSGTANAEAQEAEAQDTSLPSESGALTANAEHTEPAASPEPEKTPVERTESAAAPAEPVAKDADAERYSPQRSSVHAEPEKVYADSLPENGASAAKRERPIDDGAAPYEVIADERLPDTSGTYQPPAAEKKSSPYSRLERVDEHLPPEYLPDNTEPLASGKNAQKPSRRAEKIQDDFAGSTVAVPAERKNSSMQDEQKTSEPADGERIADENAGQARGDELSPVTAEPEEAACDDDSALPFEEALTERGMPERFEMETPPDEIAPEPIKKDSALSEFETSAEQPADSEPERKYVPKSADKKSSGADDGITLVPTGMNPPPKRSGKAEADAVKKAQTPSLSPVEKTSAPDLSGDPAITGLLADDAMPPAPAASAANLGALAKNTVPTLKELERGKYYVQIGVFKDDGNIKSIFDKYQSEYPITLVPLSSGSAKQILIGPLGVDEYGTVLNRFKSYGFKDAFLRKIR